MSQTPSVLQSELVSLRITKVPTS